MAGPITERHGLRKGEKMCHGETAKEAVFCGMIAVMWRDGERECVYYQLASSPAYVPTSLAFSHSPFPQRRDGLCHTHAHRHARIRARIKP